MAAGKALIRQLASPVSNGKLIFPFLRRLKAMTIFSEKLVGKEVTLVCFGEYVGFIHFGDEVHCRIETEAVIVCENGSEICLFPDPAPGALPLIVGKTVKSVSVDERFRVFFDTDVIVQATLNEGYESVMLNSKDQTEVY